MNNTFCILPWIHLTVFPEGEAKICCVANQTIKEHEVNLSLQSESLEGVWNSHHLREVRRNMMAGRPVRDCEHCYLAEKNLGPSPRTHANARWAAQLGASFQSRIEESARQDYLVPGRPLYYQLMPGNLCNLKCRMCFPTFSSLIEKDEVHRRWAQPLVAIPSDRRGSAGNRSWGIQAPTGDVRLPNGPWYRDDQWVREVLLERADELRCLYFTGGEPMIEKQVEKILDHLIDRGVSGKVLLDFNTNCTVLRDSMLEKLQQFKQVVLSLSLDAFGAYYEYIRYPAKWQHVQRNVEKLTALAGERLLLSAAPVLQVYNALNLDEVLRYFDEMKIHYRIQIASEPLFLSVNVLPSRVRRAAADSLRAYAVGGSCSEETRGHVLTVANYIETAEDRSNPEILRTLMLFTNDLDKSRRQSVKNVHSQLLGLLAEDGCEWTDEFSAAQPPAAALQARLRWRETLRSLLPKAARAWLRWARARLQ
jgi:wyosine [tRNA(Phe)-imidazoG37] synthetase (radical SAM superfamily)